MGGVCKLSSHFPFSFFQEEEDDDDYEFEDREVSDLEFQESEGDEPSIQPMAPFSPSDTHPSPVRYR